MLSDRPFAAPPSARPPPASASRRPARTSAPGYDTFGLALGLYDDVHRPESPTRVWRSTSRGEGAGDARPRTSTTSWCSSMRATFDAPGRPTARASNCPAPIASRTVAASDRRRPPSCAKDRLLARALVTVGGDRPRCRRRAAVLRAGGLRDRGPSRTNVGAVPASAASTLAWTVGTAAGAAWTTACGPRPAHAGWCSSRRSRGFDGAGCEQLIPATVPHVDAVFNAARAALLVAALAGATEHLLEATGDRLHQPYRAPALSGTAELVAALRAIGLAGGGASGA